MRHDWSQMDEIDDLIEEPDYDGMVEDMALDEWERQCKAAGVPPMRTWVRFDGTVGRIIGRGGDTRDPSRVTFTLQLDTDCDCDFWDCEHKAYHYGLRWPEDFASGRAQVIW